eukprot:TRINITY_DN3572_c0_g2_i1.p1 TRINITY_DN3572_c0_g2~~TRINITY_DN3572_c0_g2_i1.p1  ORF type:complete len:239 (-),score=72.88 TRINITY_DN3572_c0_g2_i1:252-968(-)
MMSRAKVARTEGGDAAAEMQCLQEVLVLQQGIERLNEDASEKIVEIERQYNVLRQPYYKKRSQLISKIPSFWKKVFMNHHLLSGLLGKDDADAFEYLIDLEVEDYEDVKSGFRINMKFAPNPYFANDVLSKEFNYSPEGVLRVVPTKIQWKSGKNLTEAPAQAAAGALKRQSREANSFFMWFDESDQEIDLAEILKEDVWPNPVRYLNQSDDEDREDDADTGDAASEDPQDGGDEEDL